MAHKSKHHRRHSSERSFGELVTVPSFGDLKTLNPIGQSVDSTDMLLGAGIGIVAGAAVKIGIGKVNTMSGGKVPTFFTGQYASAISTVLGGGAVALLLAKKAPKRAAGIFVGAVAAALVPVANGLLATQFPTYFSDYVSMPNFGVIVNTPQLGVIVDLPTANMNALANSARKPMAEA